MSTHPNRLTIDDLLSLAGTEKIVGFKWGDAICGVINPYLSVERRLTPNHTGNEALTVLKALPVPIQVLVNEVRIDVMTGQISAEELKALERELNADREEAPHTFQPHPFDHPHNDTPEYERFNGSRLREYEVPPSPARFDRHWGKGRSPASTSPNTMIMMLIAVALVFLALFLAFTTAKIASESKTQPNSGTLDVVIKTLGGVFKDSANTNPDTRGNSDRQSDDSTEDPSYRDPSSTDDPAYEDPDAEIQPSYGPR